MKKGFTVLEILLVVSFISILSLMEIDLLFKHRAFYKKMMVQDTELFYSNEVFCFIERKMKDKVKEIKVKDNALELSSKNNEFIEYIGLNRGTIAIKHIQFGNERDSKPIMRNVKAFKVKQQGGNLYFYIISESGRKFDRCIRM